MASTSAPTKTTKKGKAAAAAVAAVVPEEKPEVNVEIEVESTKISELEAIIATLTKRVEDIETTIQGLKTSGGRSKKSADKEAKPEKKTRPPTAYNLYMKEKIAELKETHPDMDNKERMKLAAEIWSQNKKAT